MKKLIIAISSAMLLATSAFSMDLRPSVGISGSMAVYAATGTEKNYNEAGTAVDTTTDEHGAFVAEYGSIFVEAALNDMISVGVDYVPMDFQTPQNVAQENESNQKKVLARFEDLTTVYAKLNIPLGGTYLKVGYSQVDVTPKTNGGGNGNTYTSDSTDGLTVGLGYNHELAGGVAVRLEVTGTYFGNVNSNNQQTNKTEIIVKDIIGARGTLSIVKSF